MRFLVLGVQRVVTEGGLQRLPLDVQALHVVLRLLDRSRQRLEAPPHFSLDTPFLFAIRGRRRLRDLLGTVIRIGLAGPLAQPPGVIVEASAVAPHATSIHQQQLVAAHAQKVPVM